jgi:hypothetical protein
MKGEDKLAELRERTKFSFNFNDDSVTLVRKLKLTENERSLLQKLAKRGVVQSPSIFVDNERILPYSEMTKSERRVKSRLAGKLPKGLSISCEYKKGYYLRHYGF